MGTAGRAFVTVDVAEDCVAVVVDDIGVAVGRRARRSVTDKSEVTDRCHVQIQQPLNASRHVNS